MYLFTSNSAGFLFWYKFSLCLTLCCTLLSSLAYFAEMTYFIANITFQIFSPTCILFVEVSTVLTFCSIVVAIVIVIVVVIVFTLAFTSESMYITTCSTTFSAPVLLKICALLSVVSHPSHML